MVTLLTDKRVGRLMQIPYPEPPSEAETLAMAAPTRVQIAQILEAFARSLGKAPEDVSAHDFADIDRLDLRGLDAPAHRAVLCRACPSYTPDNAGWL